MPIRHYVALVDSKTYHVLLARKMPKREVAGVFDSSDLEYLERNGACFKELGKVPDFAPSAGYKLLPELIEGLREYNRELYIFAAFRSNPRKLTSQQIRSLYRMYERELTNRIFRNFQPDPNVVPDVF